MLDGWNQLVSTNGEEFLYQALDLLTMMVTVFENPTHTILGVSKCNFHFPNVNRFCICLHRDSGSAVDFHIVAHAE